MPKWPSRDRRGTGAELSRAPAVLGAQYRRLAGRRGKKRALVALGHTILVIIYHLLKDRTTYRELGGDYFDRLDTERLTRTLVRRLERLGHKVILGEKEPAA
jgi:transposase